MLQEDRNDATWDGHEDLLAWLLYVGGAFAPEGPMRSDYMALIQQKHQYLLAPYIGVWQDLIETLEMFIWSSKGFEFQVEVFWTQTQGVDDDALTTSSTL